MDKTIQTAIDAVTAFEQKFKEKCSDAVRSHAAFVAVTRLVQTQDVAVSTGCSSWLIIKLQQWISHFLETGTFRLDSSLGSSDQSLLMQRLAPHFEAINGMKPSNDPRLPKLLF